MNIIDILIPIALAAVTVVLFAGIYNMWRGGEGAASRSQMLMRWRVMLQFIAIVIITIGFWMKGFRPF